MLVHLHILHVDHPAWGSVRCLAACMWADGLWPANLDKSHSVSGRQVLHWGSWPFLTFSLSWEQLSEKIMQRVDGHLPLYIRNT